MPRDTSFGRGYVQHVASQKAEAYGKKDRREVVDISFSEKGRVSENKNFE